MTPGHVSAQQSQGLRDDEGDDAEDLPPLKKQPSSLAAKGGAAEGVRAAAAGFMRMRTKPAPI